MSAIVSTSMHPLTRLATTHPIIVVLVGPYSKLSLYQQRFTAPGMSVVGSAVSTKPPSPQKINVEYTVQPIQFISGIQASILLRWRK